MKLLQYQTRTYNREKRRLLSERKDQEVLLAQFSFIYRRDEYINKKSSICSRYILVVHIFYCKPFTKQILENHFSWSISGSMLFIARELCYRSIWLKEKWFLQNFIQFSSNRNLCKNEGIAEERVKWSVRPLKT